MAEGVHRAKAGPLTGFDVGHLSTGDVHRHQWVEVDVGLDADLVGLLGPVSQLPGLLGYVRAHVFLL